MFNLTNLPSYGVVRVFAMCNVITPESAEHGDYAESGWVRGLDVTAVYESRNEVEPVWELQADADGNLSAWMSEYVDVDDALSDLQRIVGQLGAYESGDGSGLMATGTDINYRTGYEYSYSLIAHVKFFDATRGYVEEDVKIVEPNA